MCRIKAIAFMKAQVSVANLSNIENRMNSLNTDRLRKQKLRLTN